MITLDVTKVEGLIDGRYIIFGLAMAGVSVFFRWVIRMGAYKWRHKQVILALIAGFWRICAVIFPMIVGLVLLVA